jgi:thiamine monophosphate synthase
LFATNYKGKKGFLGIVKFNVISNFYKNILVPLGGIKSKNINRLKLVNSNAFCLLSEIKKKPAITSRLF